MRMPWSDWSWYIQKLRAINTQAGVEMTRFMAAHLDADISEVIEFAYALATKYGEGAAALSCEMYDALAEAQGAHVPPAEPAATATYSETAKAVRGTMKNRLNSVPDTVSRLVKQAGADTTIKNALRDGAEFAWVPHGDTCAFCLMLGSNGWRKASKKAIKNGHAEHIHAHCDCEYAVRFDGKSTIKGYDPDKLLEQYENADGDRWQDKVNSLRRDQYKVDKDKINEQKRIAYRERKAKEFGNSPVVTNTPKKPDKPTYGHRDVTEEWLQTATPNSHQVQDVAAFTQDGFTYTVDGERVKMDYSPHEKEIAELLERKLGGEILMMPKVNKPEGVRTPDYIFRGCRYDLKDIEGKGKAVLYDAASKKRRQADNFIFDVTKSPLSEAEIYRQIGTLYSEKHASFISNVILVKNGELLKVFQRT